MSHQKLLVKNILESAQCRAWTIQGLGMLRLYLSKEVRLHVWDPSRSVRKSTIHNHPWDFTSEVISGSIRNVVYRRDYAPANVATHWEQKIVCGIGGGAVPGDKATVNLSEQYTTNHPAGGKYWLHHDELHESFPSPGAVTIIERTFQPDTEHALVYFPRDQEWTSAEPRIATPQEISEITKLALDRWS